MIPSWTGGNEIAQQKNMEKWNFSHIIIAHYCGFHILGSQSDSDSLASVEGGQDDNTDDELSKVVGGLEFAIDRQESDSKETKEEEKSQSESKPKEEKTAVEAEKKPLQQLQQVRTCDF